MRNFSRAGQPREDKVPCVSQLTMKFYFFPKKYYNVKKLCIENSIQFRYNMKLKVPNQFLKPG